MENSLLLTTATQQQRLGLSNRAPLLVLEEQQQQQQQQEEEEDDVDDDDDDDAEEQTSSQREETTASSRGRRYYKQHHHQKQLQQLKNNGNSSSPKTAKFNKGDVVTLNVGGKTFVTTWDTLTKQQESMLSAMFAGQMPVKLDHNGSVFIDRDGKHFKKILNYMRNNSFHPPLDKSKCYEMYKEAEFYQLKGMLETLKVAITDEDVATESIEGSPLMGIRGKVGKQVTVIKTELERDTLLKSTNFPLVMLEVSSSSFGEEKDAIIYKHLVLFDKLAADYAEKIIFVKQILYTGKEWKFYTKGKLQHSVFFYNQYNGKHSFQEEIILDRILKLILL